MLLPLCQHLDTGLSGAHPTSDNEGSKARKLYRTILLLSVVWILVTGIIFALLVTSSYQNVQRLSPLSRHISHIVELESLRDALQERFVPQARISAQNRLLITESIDTLERLVRDDPDVTEKSSAFLRGSAAALRKAESEARNSTAGGTVQPLREALTLLRRALRAERSAHRKSLAQLAEFAEKQLQATLVLAVVIPAATLAFLVFFRRRVLSPLNDLGYLIGLLSRKDYAAAMTDHIDPLMAPLFEKYNGMVKRMRDLDQAHIKREGALQRDVEQATRALIQQQLALARADRMAAVGDLSARLAHDLRNPLSGVLMALTNLKDEMESFEHAEHAERVGVAIVELERIARLLSQLVDESRQLPEQPQRLQIRRVIEDLIKPLERTDCLFCPVYTERVLGAVCPSNLIFWCVYCLNFSDTRFFL